MKHMESLRLAGDTIANGAVLIAAGPWYKLRGGHTLRIVLCVVPDTQNYAIWYQNESDGRTHHGSYFGDGDFFGAVAEFARRTGSQLKLGLPAYNIDAQATSWEQMGAAMKQVLDSIGEHGVRA